MHGESPTDSSYCRGTQLLQGHAAEPEQTMQRPTCVIDNGTGYTKMGYAGNAEPRCRCARAI